MQRFFELIREESPYSKKMPKPVFEMADWDLFHEAVDAASDICNRTKGRVYGSMFTMHVVAKHPGTLLAFAVAAPPYGLNALMAWSCFLYTQFETENEDEKEPVRFLNDPYNVDEALGLTTSDGCDVFFQHLPVEVMSKSDDFMATVDIRIVKLIMVVAEKIRPMLDSDVVRAIQEQIAQPTGPVICDLWPRMKELAEKEFDSMPDSYWKDEPVSK